MTDPVKIIVGEGDITEVQVPEYGIIQTGGGGGGGGGSDGATFFPEVSQEGVISWTNDGGYDNPEPVNIKGPAGNDGNDGEDGTTFTPAVDSSGNLSWTNDGGKQNPQTVNIKGPAGNDGNDGEDGEDGVSPAVSFTTITGGHTMTVTDKDHPEGQSINIMDGTSGGGGTSDYDDLTNQPSINNVTLSGNKTAAELGLGTYSKPSGGIPQTDLASAVQSKLDNTVVVSDTQPTATENKLWVDTDAGAGSSYQVPTVAEMEAADNTILGNLATIESSQATAAHAVGEYIVLNGQLYKVTAAIAAGETLNPGQGGNISITDVGTCLYQTNFETIERPTLLVPSQLEYSTFCCAKMGRLAFCAMTLKCLTNWATGGNGSVIMSFPFRVEGWAYGNAGVSVSQFSDAYTKIGRCVIAPDRNNSNNSIFYCSLEASAGNFISANFVVTLL